MLSFPCVPFPYGKLTIQTKVVCKKAQSLMPCNVEVWRCNKFWKGTACPHWMWNSNLMSRFIKKSGSRITFWVRNDFENLSSIICQVRLSYLKQVRHVYESLVGVIIYCLNYNHIKSVAKSAKWQSSNINTQFSRWFPFWNCMRTMQAAYNWS